MDNKQKIILDLCGGTGAWSRPYREAGYDVRLITLPEYDVRTYIPPEKVYGILAAPPCTEFSIAKNRDIQRNLDKGMEIVNSCLGIIRICKPKFWALENPFGLLHNFLGKPKLTFQPWWYGDAWNKKTSVWGNYNNPIRIYYNWDNIQKLSGLYTRSYRKIPSMAQQHFNTHANLIPQLKDYLQYCANSQRCAKDAAFRAITPPGFAKAFKEANP